MKTILVLGASGMLGNAVIQVLSSVDFQFKVIGTVRSMSAIGKFPEELRSNILSGIDASRNDDVMRALIQAKPDVVINCVGVVKQLSESKDPLTVLPINAMFPHQLSQMCALAKARLIHVSTDCVFSGKKGGYVERDSPDATDLYGLSKYLGELNYAHTVTLRTSIIGHELSGAHSLVDWFLAQQGTVSGYTNAFFSGLPTNELARVIASYVIPNESLSGLYQVASKRISKFDLLSIVRDVYRHDVELNPSSEFVIDRSLNGDLFRSATGYSAPDWQALVKSMHDLRISSAGMSYSTAVERIS